MLGRPRTWPAALPTMPSMDRPHSRCGLTPSRRPCPSHAWQACGYAKHGTDGGSRPSGSAPWHVRYWSGSWRGGEEFLGNFPPAGGTRSEARGGPAARGRQTPRPRPLAAGGWPVGGPGGPGRRPLPAAARGARRRPGRRPRAAGRVASPCNGPGPAAERESAAGRLVGARPGRRAVPGASGVSPGVVPIPPGRPPPPPNQCGWSLRSFMQWWRGVPPRVPPTVPLPVPLGQATGPGPSLGDYEALPIPDCLLAGGGEFPPEGKRCRPLTSRPCGSWSPSRPC